MSMKWGKIDIYLGYDEGFIAWCYVCFLWIQQTVSVELR